MKRFFISRWTPCCCRTTWSHPGLRIYISFNVIKVFYPHIWPKWRKKNYWFHYNPIYSSAVPSNDVLKQNNSMSDEYNYFLLRLRAHEPVNDQRLNTRFTDLKTAHNIPLWNIFINFLSPCFVQWLTIPKFLCLLKPHCINRFKTF